MCVLGEVEYFFLYNKVAIKKDSQLIIKNASPKPRYTE